MREASRAPAGTAGTAGTAVRPRGALGASGADRRIRTTLTVVAAAPAVAVGVVAGVVLGLAAGAVAGVLAAVLLAAGAAIGALAGVRARCDRGVPVWLGGAPVDPAGHARLVNVVEGLCTSAGVRVPELRVRPGDGLNLAVAGRRPGSSTLVVTTGLVEGLDRMELEGILATAVLAIRRGEAAAGTIAAATGLGVSTARTGDDELLLDAAAVRLTRYPPGLRAALEHCARCGVAVPGVPRRTAHLWILDPEPGGRPVAGRRTLRERTEVLSEL